MKWSFILFTAFYILSGTGTFHHLSHHDEEHDIEHQDCAICHFLVKSSLYNNVQNQSWMLCEPQLIDLFQKPVALIQTVKLLNSKNSSRAPPSSESFS